MTDRPASWRMPTPKQVQRMANVIGRNAPAKPTPGPADEMPPEYWQAVLNDVSADARPSGIPIQKQRLGEIQRHLLRVTCRRCARTVEIQKADAIRLAGPKTVWKDLGQRLLDGSCQQRTGRHEEDGCWPSFD
jgi:hypothetical protein